MSNLSDDDINEVIGDGTCTHLPQVRMALEIRRHRAAVAPDRERVRSVVFNAIDEYARYVEGNPLGGQANVATNIATRAAEQLAAAAIGVVLSEEERRAVEWILEWTDRQCGPVEVDEAPVAAALIRRLLGAP